MKKAMLGILAVILAAGTWFTVQQFRKPKQSDLYRLGMTTELENLNPVLGTTEETSRINSQIQDTLYSVNGTELVPSGAKEMPVISEDKKTYTIKLRENYWTNYKGEKQNKVKASDYVFAFRTLGDPATKADYATLLIEAKIKNAAAVVEGSAKVEDLGVKALDDETLQIELESPAPYLIDLLAFNKFSPISEENVKAKGGLEKTFESMESTVYSGAYYMSETVKGEKYVITKSENYHSKDIVNIKNVSFKIYKDSDTAFSEFEQGNLDEVGINTKERVAQYKDNANTKFAVTGSTFYLANNMESEVMKNVNVRKTIQYGVDYNTIYKDVIGTGPIGTSSFTPKELTNPVYGEEYVNRLGEGRVYNQAKAKEYADKAKAELGGTVKIKITGVQDPNSKKALEAIQGELTQKYGFQVEVSQIPSKEFFAKIRKDSTSYDAVFAGWGGDYADPGTFMSILSKNNVGLNYSRNTDDELAKMIEEASAEGENNARLDKFAKAEKYAVEEKAYIVPVVQRAGYKVTSGKFSYKPNTLKVQLMKYYEVK